MDSNRREKTLCLVDGSNLVYRAFFAIRELSNSKGFPTNAIYGFTSMLMKLLRDQQPGYAVVTFDSKGPTFRHEAFEDYKATRESMPDDLVAQIQGVKDVVRGFSIPVIEQQGVEADDIIGTIATEAAAEGYDVCIVSGDKDLLQLVSDRIVMLDTMKDKSWDVAAVKEKFGVSPDKVSEILGLAGDTSDNIPGVPGVGEKTAGKLIGQFGSLESILDNLDAVKGPKLRANLEEYADQARLSRELATIRTDLELDYSLEGLAVGDPDPSVLRDLFAEFEFSSLLQQIKGEQAISGDHYETVHDASLFSGMVDAVKGEGRIAFEFVLSEVRRPVDSLPLGVGLSTGAGRAW